LEGTGKSTNVRRICETTASQAFSCLGLRRSQRETKTTKQSRPAPKALPFAATERLILRQPEQ